MTEPAHSKFSASKATEWMGCAGSIVLSKGIPNRSSSYADEGSAAHALLEACLTDGGGASFYLGKEFEVNLARWVVTDEMAGAVETALRNISEMTQGAEFFKAEQRVNYASRLNVPLTDAWGRLDIMAIVPARNELQIHDYKHGKGELVEAHEVLRVTEDGTEVLGPNPQLALYALGALDTYASLYDIDTVVLVIHQPRKQERPSEFRMTVGALVKWSQDHARPAAMKVLNAEALHRLEGVDKVWQETYLNPGERQCRWCAAKATCPALRAYAADTMSIDAATPDDFVVAEIQAAPAEQNAEWLAALMRKADLIEGWITAVRAEVERRLLGNVEVPGFKLVQGRQGNRAWASPADAEAQLKAMRLKVEEMYDLSLISPTSAEKLAKDKTIGPRQWTKLQGLITRPPGKPHVAPASDPRPAISVAPVADSFDANFEDIV